MNTENTETTQKIELVKKSKSFKIFIPAEVERKIRFLCERVWDVEWSGVLFYTHTGEFVDDSLEIHCKDIYPMDIGSSTYTEFDMSPDVISYMAQHQELLDCKTGLIHSHNNMSTFFSGTDTATLLSEGKTMKHFVSLIVNNAGKYTAAITRKVNFRNTKTYNYETFGDTVELKEPEYEEGCEIQYFYLDVVKEEIENDFAEIADRLEDIKDRKKKAIPTTTNCYNPYTNSYYSKSASLFDWQPKNDANKSSKEPELFDFDDDYSSLWNYGSCGNKEFVTQTQTDSKLSKEEIKKILLQLLTGSVTVVSSDKKDLRYWANSMVKLFDNRFGNSEKGMQQFEYWATDFTEFLLWYSPEEVVEVEELAAVAEEIINQLKKLPQNKYIEKYIEIIGLYAERI